MNYQTKPIKVEAMQWKGPGNCDGYYLADFRKWVSMKDPAAGYEIHGESARITLNERDFGRVTTALFLHPGDWLVNHPIHGLLHFEEADFKHDYEEIK